MGEDFEAEVKEGVSSRTDVQPRVLVVVGELDRVEPERSVRERVAKVLEDAGARVEIEKLMGVGHLISCILKKQVDAFLHSVE